MPIRIKNGGADTVIREEYVGSSLQRICYPGISSCISITAVLPTGLIGTHITIATEANLVDDLMQAMKSGGGAGCPNFYVVGAFSQFKPRAASTINTRRKISQKIKSRVNRNAIVRFYDTSAHGEVHVFAEKGALNTQFLWIASHGNTVAGFNYPAFQGRTPINPGHFVMR